jgi:hypothetical protein
VTENVPVSGTGGRVVTAVAVSASVAENAPMSETGGAAAAAGVAVTGSVPVGLTDGAVDAAVTGGVPVGVTDVEGVTDGAVAAVTGGVPVGVTDGAVAAAGVAGTGGAAAPAPRIRRDPLMPVHMRRGNSPGSALQDVHHNSVVEAVAVQGCRSQSHPPPRWNRGTLVEAFQVAAPSRGRSMEQVIGHNVCTRGYRR